MKVRVDADLCAGCGVCEDLCPAVFIVQDAIAKVRVNPVPPEQEQACREAVQGCPVDAIILEP